MNSNKLQVERNSILEKVKGIISLHLSGYSAKAYLFGSWARSEEKRSSDIDVAIEFETHDESTHRILTNIRHALEESTIPYKVDVVYLNLADDYIVNKVHGEGILWDVHVNE